MGECVGYARWMTNPRHPFAHVDDQSDPQQWIDVLDRLRSDPLYVRYKARIVELLEPIPGKRYLDIGVGTGGDAIELVRRHGVEVVGVDSSAAMVAEARWRGLAQAMVGDARALPFDAALFDGAWSDRTFQHLAEPGEALAEMVRVVRPGGLVVVADPDYGTQVVNIPDQELADRVLRFRAGVGNWRLSHQMRRLFVEAGLANVHTEAAPVVITEPTALDDALGLRSWAGLAAKQGMLELADVTRWEVALDQAAAGHWFLYAFCVFITTGLVAPHQT
jgi:SAM-dependent methyltransferase